MPRRPVLTAALAAAVLLVLCAAPLLWAWPRLPGAAARALALLAAVLVPLAAIALLRRLAELRAAAARYRLLAERIRDVIWTVDLTSGRLTYVSPACRELFGFSPEEQAARLGIEPMLTPESAERAQDALERALREGRDELRYEAEHMRRDGGTVWCDVHVGISRDADGQPVELVGVTRDISERRRIEASLTRSLLQLQQAQRMEAIGQLTGGIAHDFNNLLTVILGNLELAADAVGPEAELREVIGQAADAARRGADLTHRLLAFARRQPLRPTSVDPRALVDSMSELLRRSLGEGIALEVEHGPERWSCRADPAQLENAILNLALNARDAMRRGGRLRIATTAVRVAGTDARERELAAGDYVQIVVSDEGSGMAPDVAARAFEPFFTTKASGRGTGLGLSMVHGFAHQSGGEVRLESAPGSGTTVTLLLPRADGAGAAQATTRRVEASHRFAGERVLLVEDDPPVRQLVSSMLQFLGLQVVAVGTAESAFARLKSEPEIAALVSDVLLPGGVDGFELVERARKQRPDLPALLISGFAEPRGPEGRVPEDVRLLVKPFKRNDLARHLREALRGAPDEP